MNCCFLSLLWSLCCVFGFWPGPQVFFLPMTEVVLISWGLLFVIHSRYRSGVAVNRARMAVGPVFSLDGLWWWPWWYTKGQWQLREGVDIRKELMVGPGFYGLSHRRRLTFGGAVGCHC